MRRSIFKCVFEVVRNLEPLPSSLALRPPGPEIRSQRDPPRIHPARFRVCHVQGLGFRVSRFRVQGSGFASAAGALTKSAKILSPRGRPLTSIFCQNQNLFSFRASGLGASSGPFLGFWTFSQPFLGLRASSGPFLGSWTFSQPFLGFRGLFWPFFVGFCSSQHFLGRGAFSRALGLFCWFLGFFPTFSGPRASFRALP